MTSRIAEMVHRRAAGATPDESEALALFGEIINDPQFGDTDDHAVPWNATSWLSATDAWSEPVLNRLQVLADSLGWEEAAGQRHPRISRRAVFQRTDGDPEDLFLAAMAWGFGTTGYGWSRTSEIIRNADMKFGSGSGIRTAVAELRRAAEGGTEIVFRAWSRGGAAKIPDLGTAFASKIAYFAAYDRDEASGPLIADLNTTWSFWALNGIWDSRDTAAEYRQYVSWAEEVAEKLTRRTADGRRIRSDGIERALFKIGPDVRRAWASRPG